MKNNFTFFSIFFIITIILSSCASYNIAIMDERGNVMTEHQTQKVYVGTDMFIPDAVLGTLGAVASMFYPFPQVKSSMGVGGGVSLGAHVSNMAGIATSVPASIFGGGGGGASQWVTFDDINGQRISYNGYNYIITRVTKAEMVLPDSF